jgi:hypothetical protein
MIIKKMMSKILTYQNEDKYCKENPNKYGLGIPSHYYINNNCKYCNCEKFYTINVASRVANYINKYG